MSIFKRTLSLEAREDKINTCYIVKGNPSKQFDVQTTKKFYNDIENGVKPFYKIKYLESDIPFSDFPKTTNKDIIVLFSRGDRYAKYLSTSDKNVNTKVIGIHIRPAKDLDISSSYLFAQYNNNDDKVLKNDFSKKSLKAHWTFESKDEFKNLIKNLNS